MQPQFPLAPVSSGSSSSAPWALTLPLLALEEYNYLHSSNSKWVLCRVHRGVCWLSPALKSSFHMPPAFQSKPVRRDSACSLVTAAFCPDPKALRAEVRDAEAAFKILQVLMEQGLLSTVWGAACVPSGGPLDLPHRQSGSGGSGNAHVSTSPFPCNPPQRVSVPHNWVSLILHFQSDT